MACFFLCSVWGNVRCHSTTLPLHWALFVCLKKRRTTYVNTLSIVFDMAHFTAFIIIFQLAAIPRRAQCIQVPRVEYNMECLSCHDLHTNVRMWVQEPRTTRSHTPSSIIHIQFKNSPCLDSWFVNREYSVSFCSLEMTREDNHESHGYVFYSS